VQVLAVKVSSNKKPKLSFRSDPADNKTVHCWECH